MKINALFLILILIISCKNEINKKRGSISFKEIKNDVQNTKFNTYCNDRFQFCIEYPKNFTPQGESHNGDGQSFLSEDKKSTLIVSGIMSIVDVNPTIKEHFEMVTIDENITYKVLKKDFFIISGYNKNGDIFYQKTLAKNFKENNKNTLPDYYQTLKIVYPKNQSKKYSEYCKKISNFK